MTQKNKGLRTWLEIDTKKAAQNYRLFRKLLGQKTKLMAVVKSNAYGHDLFQFAKLQEKLGTDWLGVDSIVEGEALREAGIKIPILVLGYTLPEKFAVARKNNLSLTISNFENLKWLKKFPVKFHLKVDTGMHRQGFLPEQVAKILSDLPKKYFAGIYTHFAAAKNPAFPAETLVQLAQFQKIVKMAKNKGFTPIAHAAATSGTLLFPETHLDLVRVGIGLYGLWPSLETRAAREQNFPLQPILSWKTIIGEIKNLPAGSKIGYDLTETLSRATTIGICPIGYWHGYPRALSSIGQVLVNDQRCRVLGRISMDMTIIDLGPKNKAKVGDVVTLLGPEISAAELGALAGTINYEMVTRLNPLIRRIYI